jgi:hypothetical protein
MLKKHSQLFRIKLNLKFKEDLRIPQAEILKRQLDLLLSENQRKQRKLDAADHISNIHILINFNLLRLSESTTYNLYKL